MKLLHKALLTLLTLTGIGGCKKVLDTRIDTSLTPSQVGTDYSNLWRFGYQPYVTLNSFNGFTAIDGNLFAAVTDDAVQTQANANAILLTNGSYNQYNNPGDIYELAYTGIRAANFFLENSTDYRAFLARNRDTITDHQTQYQLDVSDIGWLRAESHILRAYFYLELAKRYGGVPLVTRTLSATENNHLPRAGFDEVINYIVNEVDLYRDSLQRNWKTLDQSKDGRITTGAALTIKAKALLLSASPLHNTTNDVNRWKKAAAAFNDVITLGLYSLNSSYQNLFLQDNTVNSSETIWALRLGSTNLLERLNYPIGTPGGNSGIAPTQNLVDEYEYKGTPDAADPYKNRDPRFYASIVTNNSFWNGRTIQEYPGGTDDMSKTNTSRTGYYLAKFLNSNLNLLQGEARNRSWIFVRYAEVLLSYAEAMNEAYGPTAINGYTYSAAAALNLVRNRPSVAMPAVTATSPTVLRQAIKHERRIELSFEGSRYWDLLRWKDAETVLTQVVRGVRVSGTSTTFSYTPITVEQRVFIAPKMYFFPIPQAEISKAGGALVQNPGW